MSTKDILRAINNENPAQVRELVRDELYNRAMGEVDSIRDNVAPTVFSGNKKD
jgi:hypothetical protein